MRNAFVTLSEGKIEVVTPSSAPMFVIVARSGTDSVSTPSPPYSTIDPTFPFVVRISSSLRMTSLAATHGWRFPVRFTLTTFGYVM